MPKNQVKDNTHTPAFKVCLVASEQPFNTGTGCYDDSGFLWLVCKILKSARMSHFLSHSRSFLF